MRITINIPPGFSEDIVINIGGEIPFTENLTQEDMTEEYNRELTVQEKKDYYDSNPVADYLTQYMSGDSLELIDEGGDIDVG